MPSSLGAEQRVTYHTSGSEASRLYAKKTIVVGNVSKYVIKLDTSRALPVMFLRECIDFGFSLTGCLKGPVLSV